MTVVLDTSFLSDVRRGDKEAAGVLARLTRDGEVLLIPSPVVAEYLAGSRQPEADLATLEQAATLEDFRVSDAQAAADLARRLFARGRFPGWVDTFVAGFAKARGDVRIVTDNARHFPENRTLGY